MQWIKNVKIEVGREEVSYKNIKTITKMVAICVEDGDIVAIENSIPDDINDAIDAKGYLMLPSFTDNHIHLDKGHYGGPWQATLPLHGVKERIKEEQGFLKEWLQYTPKRAQAIVDLLTSKGVTFMRVQVNVDPVIGLQNAEIIKQVLKANEHRLDYEIVAFPQHGTLETEALGLLSKAMEDDDITVLGGIDPASIDGDIEKSLTTTFDIAKKYHKKIDIHLHDEGTLGIFEIERIIAYTLKYEMEGRVQISHALALADISDDELRQLAKKLKEANIAINTTVPVDIRAFNLPLLKECGVDVYIVNDNFNDHWRPFGSGDIVERTSRSADVFNCMDEVALSNLLGCITYGMTPLDEDGELAWPKVHNKANFVFVNAESSAHLIARNLQGRVVMFDGNIVSGEFE